MSAARKRVLPDWLAADPLQHAPRLALKTFFLGLGVYALLAVSWPTQAKSWGLWITDQELASATALLLTLAAAGIVGVSTAASHGGRWFTGLLGLALGVGIYLLTIGAAWNFYLHESTKNGTAVLEASQRVASASTTRLAEIDAELGKIDTRERETLAPLNQQILSLPPGPTLRQVTASRDQAAARFAAERDKLQAERAALRARDTQINSSAGIVNTTPVDARPLDVELALFLGVPRTAVGSVLDLVRSAVVEAFLVLFLALVLADRPPPRAARQRGRFAGVVASWLDWLAAQARASAPAGALPQDEGPRPATMEMVVAVVAVARTLAEGRAFAASFDLTALVRDLAQAVAARPAKPDPAAGKPDADRPDANRPDPGKPDPAKPDAGKPDPGKPDRPHKPNKGLPWPTDAERAAALAKTAQKEPVT